MNKLTQKQKEYLIDAAKTQLNSLESVIDLSKSGKKIPKKFEWETLNDISEYIRYYTLISFGQFDKAAIIQRNMDTSVYEEIPNKIWGLLERL